MNVYTLDSAGWPLIINKGDEVVATFPLPAGSTGDDVSGLLQLARATDLTIYLNGETPTTLQLAREVAEDTVSLIQCNCSYDVSMIENARRCDGSCTHGMAERLLARLGGAS